VNFNKNLQALTGHYDWWDFQGTSGIEPDDVRPGNVFQQVLVAAWLDGRRFPA
jgi:hypothetical protein